jgi:glyoxylase-like metal-dependent hydrolase (beta-lactamase superfamily II)
MVCWPLPVIPEMAERQEGFIAPNLSPRGLVLHPHELADGVYGLMANKLPKDNNGVIIGEKAALVVDSGITPGMGTYIQEVVAGITDVPVRFLANTTYHGDHSFGNVAFSDDVVVVSSRLNKAAMEDLEEEKFFRSDSMYGDDALDSVTSWRKPDVTFDRFLEVDLGGRVVHLWHFGPGNGSGDTIVHVPDANTAWVGNFLRHPGIPPMLLAGDPVGYLRSLRAMQSTLRLDHLVPGHGPLTGAVASITWMHNYLHSTTNQVEALRDAGASVDEVMDEVPLPEPLRLSSVVADADEEEDERFSRLMLSLHRLNMMSTYRWLASTRRPSVVAN